VRASRRVLCPEEPPQAASRRGALLSMRYVFDGIKKCPHPEEAAKRPSRRTHSDDPTDATANDRRERSARRNAIAYSLALGVVDLLGQGAGAQLLERKALSPAAARRMVAAAAAEAERNHWRGVVAVFDDGGWIILLERMDHAALTAGVELAPGKAQAAALHKKPSQALEQAINQGRYAAITARGFIEMQGHYRWWSMAR